MVFLEQKQKKKMGSLLTSTLYEQKTSMSSKKKKNLTNKSNRDSHCSRISRLSKLTNRALWVNIRLGLLEEGS